MQRIEKNRKINAIILIYVVMLLFNTFKLFFYAQHTGLFFDEPEHVSYIAYLESTKRVIPEFKDMKILVPAAQQPQNIDTKAIGAREGYSKVQVFGSKTNYLGHPPLYYQIMRLTGGVKVQGQSVTINIYRLRVFNILLATLALTLIFYIGFSRIGLNPAYHLLYAAICISVPMFSYVSAGVNNDTMSLIGVTVFFFGLLRFSEGKRNAPTFLLIGAGVFITLLSKLTAGMVALLALGILLWITAAKEKSLRFLLSKDFLLSVPFYFAAALYFLIVYRQTGEIQPTYIKLNPSQFYTSFFYTPPAERSKMNFSQYVGYYFNDFLYSWTGISTYTSLIKKSPLFSLDNIGLSVLWILPLPLFFFFRRRSGKTSALDAALAVYTGLILTAVYQFLRAYHEFKDISGYLGGFQSRYYVCTICALSFAVVLSMKNVIDRLRMSIIKSRQINAVVTGIVCSLYSGLLFYEDVGYFLFHFKDYI